MFWSVPQDVVVGVVDAGGRIALRSTGGAAYIGTPLPVNSVLRTAVADGSGSALSPDGVIRLFAHVRIPEFEWRVAAGVPRATVMAEYDRIFNSAVLMAALLSAMALAAAHQLGVAIVRPIRRLQTAAARVAEGDDHERAETAGPPEVRALAEQFNHMVDVRSLAQSRLQGILDSAMDAIVSADESQTIVKANPAASAMFGHPVESLVGMPLERLIPPRHHALHRREVEAFGKNRLGQHHMGRQREVSATRADGSEFPVEATISHLLVDGRIMYTAILRDVSERVKAAQALRASEQMLRRLLQQLPEAVFVNTDMQVTFVNDAAQELFGASEDKLVGLSPLELIHPDFHALAIQRISVLQEGAPIAPLADIRILRMDGTTREVETLCTLIEHEGQTSVLAVLRDVTDLRMAQRELEKSRSDLRLLVAAMEDVQEQERLRISRDLHDDLQQTLAAIRMDADALAERAGGDGAVAADATRIDTLAASAIASIRRLISGLRPQLLDELGLVDALHSLARDFSKRNGIRCECLIAPEMESAEIDSRKSTCLYRVVQESLNNVLKHAAARYVEIRFQLDQDGTHCRLSIRDDGRGMRSEDCDKPDSFGLIGMRERVRAAGGTLRIEALPGAGTLIEVRVPIA
jgi:PAS domain S-box-containing protein